MEGQLNEWSDERKDVHKYEQTDGDTSRERDRETEADRQRDVSQSDEHE